MPPLEVTLMEFRLDFRRQKTSPWANVRRYLSDYMFSRFDVKSL